MKTIKVKPSKKGATAKGKEKSPATEKKKISAIAKYWQTMDSSDWEIVDMRAVLR
jgi:hypothetical protein